MKQVYVVISDNTDGGDGGDFSVIAAFADRSRAEQVAEEIEAGYDAALAAYHRYAGEFQRLMGSIGQELVAALRRDPTHDEMVAEARRRIGDPPALPRGHTCTVAAAPLDPQENTSIALNVLG